MLDVISIKHQPLPFLAGFMSGLIMDKNSKRGKKLLELKEMGSTIQGSFTWKDNALPTIIQTSAAILGIYILPKIAGLLPEKPNEISIFSLIKGCALLIASGFAFVQGWSSLLRCEEKVISANNHIQQLDVWYQRNRESVRAALPLMPVQINVRTVDRSVKLMPHIYRFITVYGHCIPLQRNLHSFVYNVAFSGIGFVVWLKFWKPNQMIRA